MLDDPLSGLLRAAAVGTAGHLRPQHVLRHGVAGDAPAVGPALLVLRVLEAVDGDVGLHLEVGNIRIEALQAAADEARQPLQIFGQRGSLPEQHVHDLLLPVPGEAVLVADVEVVAVAPVVGQIRVSLSAD